jgi:CO dehydrogenase maturation factor
MRTPSPVDAACVRGRHQRGRSPGAAVRCDALAAIDADINQHLGVALGLDEADAAAVPPLGAHLTDLKDNLRGSNPRIASAAAMVKTTPPGRGSRLLRLTEPNPVWQFFERDAGGVRLLATGPFGDDDLGVACYHSKVGAAELILNHLVDGQGSTSSLT